MTKKATFRATGSPARGVSHEEHAREQARRQRNARLKDEARARAVEANQGATPSRAIPGANWRPVQRAASGGHTPEQLAERERHINTIVAHDLFKPLGTGFFARWSCDRLAKLAGEIKAGVHGDGKGVSAARRHIGQQVRRAREKAAEEERFAQELAEAAMRAQRNNPEVRAAVAEARLAEDTFGDRADESFAGRAAVGRVRMEAARKRAKKKGSGYKAGVRAGRDEFGEPDPLGLHSAKPAEEKGKAAEKAGAKPRAARTKHALPDPLGLGEDY